jgi:hypothetical protein
MRGSRVCITLGCCLFALASVASAQSRKPGLWTITTTVTYPPSANGAAGRPTTQGPFNTNVCLTQALIDKYGSPLPQIKDCKITSFNRKANSVTADLVCSGASTGKATMESTWTADHATGSIHVITTAPRTTEWTSTSTSVFKSADCGAVQPFPMPAQ